MGPCDPPLLRSPPFASVPAAVAAVSRHGRTTIADPDALLGAIRDAGVAGAFWKAGEDLKAPVRGAPEEDAVIAAWLSDAPVADRSGAPIAADVLRMAALGRLAGASYRDPFADAPTDAMRVVDILANWRRTLDANRPITTAVGMAGWKREAIAAFLWDGVASPRYAGPTEAARIGGVAAYWPSRTPAGFPADIAASGGEAWAVEDGLLRSNGLGAECRPPLSILVDRRGGIYFDPDRPSEMELILQHHAFSQPLLDRAAALRERIVAARLGKYGVDRVGPVVLPMPDGRRTVLAVGQVDDDLSVLRGGGGIAGNGGFLAAVRAADPDAFVIYRPHPDVAAGLRRGNLPDPVASGLADHVAAAGSLTDLVARVDAVHVRSSLTGFEALLRGREVVVHGSPFYAGWGLTRDLAVQPARRTRLLTVDMLVAGALILAPRYRDPVTGLPCEVETLVERLVAQGAPTGTVLTGFRRALGATRRTFAARARR